MPWDRFLAFNAAGGLVWASVMGLAAYALGSGAEHLGATLGIGLAAVAVLAMAGVTIYLKCNEKRIQRAADRDPAPRHMMAA